MPLPTFSRRLLLAASFALLPLAAAAEDAAPAAPQSGTIGPVKSPADLAKPSPLGDMALGKADAPVTVIEYASMTCMHCAAFDKESFPKLKAYVDSGQVRYIFREFPLDMKAAGASIVSRCIAKDDSAKYFALTDTLFKTQETWVFKNTGIELQKIAEKEGLDKAAFEACFGTEATLAGIKETQAVAADKLMVNSTPTFFVNGTMIKGNAWDEIEKAIKAQVKG